VSHEAVQLVALHAHFFNMRALVRVPFPYRRIVCIPLQKWQERRFLNRKTINRRKEALLFGMRIVIYNIGPAEVQPGNMQRKRRGGI
jgi:hypothetical protein